MIPEGRAVYQLEEETEADWWEVEALYDLCFAPGRTALSSYRLRDGVATVASLCLVLRDETATLAAAIRSFAGMARAMQAIRVPATSLATARRWSSESPARFCACGRSRSRTGSPKATATYPLRCSRPKTSQSR